MNRVYKCFPNGLFKALTLSYDDGKIQDKHLVEIFNKNGIKATFNVNSGMVQQSNRIPMSEWNSVYDGHEIAMHTCTHPTLNRCSDYEVLRELIEDKTAIEKAIQKPVYGLAFPNGSYDDRICRIASEIGVRYARTASDQYVSVKAAKDYSKYAEGPILLGDETGFNLPLNYMHWVPTCHHNHNLIEFGKDFIQLYKKQYLYILYVWGHSFEFDTNNNWKIMEEFCEMIGHRDDIWYATNIEIVLYNEAFERLVFFADNEYAYNPSAMSVWVVVNNKKIVEIKGGATVKLVQ